MKMKTIYADWIRNNFPSKQSAKLSCLEATAFMKHEFPELTRVRGHVLVGIHFRPHWWLITEDGEIVDPTSHQWDEPISLYDPLPNDAEEPVGRCLECGDLSFRSLGGDSYYCHECLKS